jgi:MFS family permease
VTSTPVFFAGLVITGAGFGSAFVAALGSVAPLARPDQRAELFASIFIVSYAGFGGSAVLVGLAVPPFGLRPTAIVFGAAVIVLALLAAATGARRVPAHRGHRISTARAQREVVPIVEAAPRVEAVSVAE